MNIPAQLAAALADRYEIEREIGKGGMATVYLARDVRHVRPVALKVLARGDQADPRPAGRPYLGISSDLAPSPGDAW
jgi:serine/threonine protein kinase